MPKFSLTDVFAVIDSGDEKRIWFSAKRRSVAAVIEVFRRAGTPKTYEEAVRFILEGIKTLTDADYVQTTTLFNDPTYVVDLYGVSFDGRPWYVKFRLDDDGDLEELSFHPPETEMRTVGGKLIQAGDPV